MKTRGPVVDGTTVTITFETDAGASTSARFEMPPDITPATGLEAPVVIGWFPAMNIGEPLVVDGAVSPRLRAGLDLISDVVMSWDRYLPGPPVLQSVSLQETTPIPDVPPAVKRPTASLGAADPGTAGPGTAGPGTAGPGTAGPGTAGRGTAGRGAACFFTGGADSFHSAIKHREHLDALIYVHGFDLLDDPLDELNRSVLARLRDSAQSLGLPLIEVTSNLVAFSAGFNVHWDAYHGAALAAVAHLLSAHFGTFYVPATATYPCLYPLGSHPLLDPAWSSEHVEIIHDGAEATRTEKLRYIADHPAARRHLRVCSENRGGAYNCGECEKCIRTGAGIRIAGVEGAFETIPPPSLLDIAKVKIRGRGYTWIDYRDELDRSGSNPRLRSAISLALTRHSIDRALNRHRARRATREGTA